MIDRAPMSGWLKCLQNHPSRHHHSSNGSSLIVFFYKRGFPQKMTSLQCFVLIFNDAAVSSYTFLHRFHHKFMLETICLFISSNRSS